MLLNSQPVFTPLNLPNCKLWLDATQTPLGAVATWNDLSGNSNNATQVTSIDRPVCSASQWNGLNALTFNGSQGMDLPSALYAIPNGNSTAFIVTNTALDTTFQRILNWQNGGGSILFAGFQPSSGVISYGNGSAPTIGSITKSNMNIIIGRISGTTQGVSINGGAEANNASYTNALATSAFIGGISPGNQPLIGDIGELLIYNRTLSSVEIAAVDSYLRNKWSIVLS